MQYSEYIQSEKWASIRKLKLLKSPSCQICSSNNSTHVHHKHYRTFEKERITDLITLCASCHSYLHRYVGHSVRKINKIILRIKRLIELGADKKMAFYAGNRSELFINFKTTLEKMN